MAKLAWLGVDISVSERKKKKKTCTVFVVPTMNQLVNQLLIST